MGAYGERGNDLGNNCRHVSGHGIRCGGHPLYSFSDSANQAPEKAERQRPERRRSNHLVVHVPVLVFGDTTNEEPVFEETTTLEVNAHGGLLSLATSPKTGQRLWLTSRVNQQEQECHVVRLGPERQGKTEVAIEFTRPVPDFWHAES